MGEPPNANVAGALERAFIAGALAAEVGKHMEIHPGAEAELARVLASSGEYAVVLKEGRPSLATRAGRPLDEDLAERLGSGAYDHFGRRLRPVEALAAERQGRQSAFAAAAKLPPSLGWGVPRGQGG